MPDDSVAQSHVDHIYEELLTLPIAEQQRLLDQAFERLVTEQTTKQKARKAPQGADGGALCADCWKLTRPLLPDDELPGCLCLPTMQATVEGWLAEQWALAQTIGADTATEPAPELEWYEADPVTKEPYPTQRRSMPLMPVAVQPESFVGGVWPILYNGRPLMLVIRQWARLEEGRETLANLLATDTGWQHEVSLLRMLLQGETLYPEQLHRSRAAPDAGMRRYRLNGFQEDRAIAQRLRLRGLPDSPAVVAHLRAAAAGQREPLPARELLVTTCAYAEEGYGVGNFRFQDRNADISITGALEHATGDLFKEAQKTALEHRNWLQHDYGRHPFTDRVNIGKALPTRPQSRSTDYLQEALSATKVRGLAAALESRQRDTKNPGAVWEEIEHYLDATQDRVRHRLVRAKRPEVEPPHAWRDDARRALRPLLNERLPVHLKLD